MEPARDPTGARLAAFGARSLVRFARWRGRRAAERELRAERQGRAAGDPAFRGFIQINLIRSR